MVTIRFKFDVPCPVKGRAEVLKAHILPHSASGPTSPDDKQKSRVQVLRLFYHSIPSDGSRTDSSGGRGRREYCSAIRWNKDDSDKAPEPRYCEPQQSSELKRETEAKCSLIRILNG